MFFYGRLGIVPKVVRFFYEELDRGRKLEQASFRNPATSFSCIAYIYIYICIASCKCMDVSTTH